MDRWKAEMGRVREEKRRRKKIKKEKVSEERRSRCAKKVGKSRKPAFFPMICGSRGSKSRLAKAAGAEPARWEMKKPLWREAHFDAKTCKTPTSDLGAFFEIEMWEKCTPLWREARFQVKMHKAPQLPSTFRSCDVEKVHAVVSRSTCRSQNV